MVQAIEIARNEVEFLKHGWYCVRNRSTQEILDGWSMSQRHQKEKDFFSRAPFDKIEKKRTGIANLKTNLGRLLSNHIAREFPEIRKEIESRYKVCLGQLEALGAPRQNAQEQRQHLTRIATMYQRKIEDVSTGRYTAAGMHPSKLRMHLQEASDRFNENIHAHGYSMSFKTTNDEYDGFKRPGGTTEKKMSMHEQVSMPQVMIIPPKAVTFRKARTNYDSDDTSTKEIGKERRDIYQQIQELWHTSRGKELPGMLPIPASNAAANNSRSRKPIGTRDFVQPPNQQLAQNLQQASRRHHRNISLGQLVHLLRRLPRHRHPRPPLGETRT